jgi:DNA-binding LacI/PurR family transcriptional regulator
VRRVVVGRNRPDAIIASDDYVAAHLVKTLGALGLRVPDDVLLAGINGDLVAEETNPPLTTVVQPCQAIGQAAARLMLDRIADPRLIPREVLLSTRLVVRASTVVGARKSTLEKAKKGKP